MTKHNNGGPAFPLSDSCSEYVNSNRSDANGMHLRDYFAAKAMRLYFLGEDSASLSGDPKQIAAWSYAMADAMLKSRETA